MSISNGHVLILKVRYMVSVAYKSTKRFLQTSPLGNVNCQKAPTLIPTLVSGLICHSSIRSCTKECVDPASQYSVTAFHHSWSANGVFFFYFCSSVYDFPQRLFI